MVAHPPMNRQIYLSLTTNTSLLQTHLKKWKERVIQDLEKKARTIITRVVSRASLYPRQGA